MGHLKHLSHLRHLSHVLGGGKGLDNSFSGQMNRASTNLQLWLRLNESSGTNANDSSSNNRDGTYSTTFGSTNPLLGLPGLTKGDVSTSANLVAADFNYITVPNFTTGYASYTILMKIRPLSANLGRRLISQRSGAGTWFDFYFDGSGFLTVYDGTSTQTISATPIVAGTNYIIFIRVSGTTLTVYMNGAAETPVTITANTSDPAEALSIGCLNNAVFNEFNGYIQDVAIWSRALSVAGEITPLTTASAKTAVTVTSVTRPAVGRALFNLSVSPYPSSANVSTYAPLEIDAGGLGYISPTVISAPMDFEYAVAPASTNAWRIATELPFASLSFEPTNLLYYLKMPSSGTVT